MSAYIVSSRVLANSVHALLYANSVSGSNINLANEDQEAIAKALFAVNKNAVANRYNEDELQEVLPSNDMKEQLKLSSTNDHSVNMESLNELLYQCSEDLDEEYKKMIEIMEKAYDVMKEEGIKPRKMNERENLNVEIRKYDEEEKNIINEIVNISERAGVNAEFLSSENSNYIYDQIFLSKKGSNILFGKIDVQSNIGTTFTDPKEIIKGHTSDNNNLVYGLIIKGIIEESKKCGRELSFEERLNNIAEKIWSDNVHNIRKNSDDDIVDSWSEDAITNSGLFIYNKDARDFMDEALSSSSNFDYDEEEYDLCDGGREERDMVTAHSIANRYLVENLKAKLEDFSNNIDNENKANSISELGM